MMRADSLPVALKRGVQHGRLDGKVISRAAAAMPTNGSRRSLAAYASACGIKLLFCLADTPEVNIREIAAQVDGSSC